MLVGDVIMVNLGEMYDGLLFEVGIGCCWWMLYFVLVLVVGVVVEEGFGGVEFVYLVVCDVWFVVVVGWLYVCIVVGEI